LLHFSVSVLLDVVGRHFEGQFLWDEDLRFSKVEQYFVNLNSMIF